MNFELSYSGHLVRIEPIGLVFPESELDWDRNWIQSLVTVKGSTFSGQYRADFMTTDFELFKRQLKALYTDLNSTANFKPLEEQLTLTIKGDGLGHFEVNCVATPQSHTEETLSLSLSFDQTSLPGIISQLDKITKAFPIDGDFLPGGPLAAGCVFTCEPVFIMNLPIASSPIH